MDRRGPGVVTYPGSGPRSHSRARWPSTPGPWSPPACTRSCRRRWPWPHRQTGSRCGAHWGGQGALHRRWLQRAESAQEAGPRGRACAALVSKNSDQSKIGSSCSNGTHDRIMGHHGDGCAVTLHPRFSTGLSPEAPSVQTYGALLGVQGGQRALPLSSLPSRAAASQSCSRERCRHHGLHWDVSPACNEAVPCSWPLLGHKDTAESGLGRTKATVSCIMGVRKIPLLASSLKRALEHWQVMSSVPSRTFTSSSTPFWLSK